MSARESDQENENELDLTVFVDFEPSEICALAECGEFSWRQFSSLMSLCSDDVARSVFEGLADSTLQAFFLSQEDLQPLLETAIVALGAEELRRRAKQWLVKASKARAKDETFKCSSIIQAIVSHQAKLSTPSQRVSERLPRPGPPSTQSMPSTNQQERLATPGVAAQPNVAPLSPSIHPPIASIPIAKTGVYSRASRPPLSPEQAPSSADLPSLARLPQPFPLDASQATEPRLPRSPKHPNSPSPTSPTRQPHNVPFHASPSARPSGASVIPPFSSAGVQEAIAGGHLLPAQADVGKENPGATPDLPTDEVMAPSPPLFLPPAQDSLAHETSLPNSLQNSGDQRIGRGVQASQSKDPLETEALGDLHETVDQSHNAEEAAAEPGTRISSMNPWDAATNAERVEEWELEDMIHSDPHHTSPFRTEWMYEDRKRATGKNDEEYKALTDQEYSRFAEVPPAVREHAGRVFNKRSKFDWEIRVVLGRLAYDYSQMDEPENRKFLHNALPEIETRFPDLSPAHVFRNIDDEGPKAVQKWRSDVTKWVQTTAGKMGGTHNNLEHRVEILESKKSSKKFDANQLLGRTRAEVNYVLWGRSKEGKKACNPIVDAEMKVWKEVTKNKEAMALDSKVFGQHRVNVEGRVRRQKFEKLPQEEQDKWTRQAKAKFGDAVLTDEELQAAAECLLPHLHQVVGQSAEIADLHIILLASGTISGGRIPVIMKEFGVKPSQGPFLDINDVGGRAKAEYPNYVSNRFQADPSELVVLDQGGEENLDLVGDQTVAGKPKNTNKGKGKATDPETTRVRAQGESAGSSRESHPALSHWKPSATINTDAKRADYLSRFFTRTFKLNFPSKIPWNKVSSDNDRYVDPRRRPQDSKSQPMQLMNPLGMPVETHLKPWWDFMQDCAQGRVSADQSFCWKPETTRKTLPSIPIPADPNVHMAGELSRTANPGKRPRAHPKSGRKKLKPKSNAQPISDEPEMDLDIDMESEEEVDDGMEDEPRSPRVLRSRPVPRIPSAADLGCSNSGDEEESGTSGSEFEPAEGPSRARGSASTSRPSVPPANGARPPQSPPLASAKATLQSVPSLLTGNADTGSPRPTFGPHSSSDALQSTPQQPAIALAPVDPPSNASNNDFTPENVPSAAATNFITFAKANPTASAANVIPAASSANSLPVSSFANAIPAISSANALPASSPANALPASSSSNTLPASSSANFTPTSISEGNPSKGSEMIISSTNTLLTPTAPLPFTELHLVHPQMFSVEATAPGSPAWLQVKPLWETWGSKMAFLDANQCDISLSPGSPKPDVKLPSALTSAVSIAQIYLALQLSDPYKPNTPPVKVSPTCHLDDLHPHHHLRQAVEGILDVKTPLPSTKALESNMLLSIEALDAFFGSLEGSLGSFLNELTSSEQTLRYAEVEFFTSLRLAILVKGTTFMRDEGDPGPSFERVNSLMDRFVTVLAGIAVLRYMQEYLGGALARWTREESDKSSTRWEMWYTFLQLWKAGISGLASALSQGRKDLFQYRAIGAIISPSVKSIVDHLMANPAWWSPREDGVPVAFQVGLKQFVPSEALFQQLPHIQWSRFSFLDRASVLLLLFICAIQISQESSFSARLLSSTAEEPASLVSLFIARCRDLRVVIEGSIGKEEGPKYSPDASENEVRRRNMVEAWIKVWQTEGGPESPAGPEGALIIRPSAKATVRIPVEEPEAMDLDEPEIVTTGPQVDSTLEATQDTGAIEEEGGVQPAGSKESDPEADVVGVAGKKRKRKVPVGGRRIAEPSVGLAENPRQRLKEIAAKAPEQEAEEERPRRKAYLNSPYVSATQGSRADQTSHLGANKESSKKPKAITAKVKATANASAPSSSPRKLTKRQASVESARKTAQAKAAKKAAGR